ncbi:hypothetical protein HOO65_011141 [Ceratocystis lukuohia]|uniref:Uncharacterized protein n=2 Tax=Ceratocystis TaxID=5157 RepID=A0A2C5XG28_9PEZI|nr:hypothetical protein CFIMG_007210RA00001 [Ceratocystis fimbriata CBS 114723]
MPLKLHLRKSSNSSISTQNISSPIMQSSSPSPTFSTSTTLFSPITPRTGSISSTSSSFSSSSHRRSRTLDIDPLSFHPVFHAPPRLQDRPYLFTPSTPKSPSSTMSVRSPSTTKIILQKPRSLPQHLRIVHAIEEQTSFYDDASDFESFIGDDEEVAQEDEYNVDAEEEEDFDLQNSQLVQEFYGSSSEEVETPVMLQRPSLQRSHWSESTIASSMSDDTENAEHMAAATDDVTITSIENADEHQQLQPPTKALPFPSLPLPPYPAEFLEDPESESEEDRDYSPLSPVSERAPTPHPQPQSEDKGLSAPSFPWKRETMPILADEAAVEERFRRGGWKRCGGIFDHSESHFRFVGRNSSPATF